MTHLSDFSCWSKVNRGRDKPHYGGLIHTCEGGGVANANHAKSMTSAMLRSTYTIHRFTSQFASWNRGIRVGGLSITFGFLDIREWRLYFGGAVENSLVRVRRDSG